MATHLEISLQGDVDRIRRKVTEMSALAERALGDCMRAIAEDNRPLAYAVVLRDRYIDEKEKEIDRLCLEFLVRQQPVGSLLRFAYSAIKINLELERVGDYAESVARQFLKLGQIKVLVPKERIAELAGHSIPMLHDATRAFVEQDAELARKTIAIEEVVDLLKSRLNKDLVALFRDHQIPFEALNPLMMIARRFEHVSDQAKSICQETLYVCTGQHVKHEGADVFRVLFVDHDNACLSQMAEAIGTSLGQPKFQFSSAGLAPRPIDPRTARFLADKGLTLGTSKAPNQIPHLELYRVIVAFGKGVRQALHLPPAKRVELDWDLADPAQSTGSEAEVRAAYEQAFACLQGRIRDLVQAILGTKIESQNKPTNHQALIV